MELHVLVNTIINKRKGRADIGCVNHPETRRYEDHLGMLYDRHDQHVKEMTKRGYNHKSPLTTVKYNRENFTHLDNDYQQDIRLLASRQEIKDYGKTT